MAAIFSELHDCTVSSLAWHEEPWWQDVQRLKALAAQEWQEEQWEARKQFWALLVPATFTSIIWGGVARAAGASWPVVLGIGVAVALVALVMLALVGGAR